MSSIQCVICTENYTQSEQVTCTPCGHIYHSICLSQWQSQSPTCPQCRNDFPPELCQRIYFSFDGEDATSKTEADLFSTTEQLNKSKKRYKHALDKLRGWIDAYNILSHKYDRSKATKVKLQENLNEIARELSDERTNHTTEMANKDESINEMFKELNVCQAKLKEITDQLKKSEKRAADYQHTLAHRMSTIDTMNKKCLESDNKRLELLDIIHELKRRLKQAEKKSIADKCELVCRDNKIEYLNRKMANDAELKQLRATVSDLQYKLSKMTKKYNILKQQNKMRKASTKKISQDISGDMEELSPIALRTRSASTHRITQNK